MAYSKKYLEDISGPTKFGGAEHTEVNQKLFDTLFKGGDLTLAEELHVCSALIITHSDNPNFDNKPSNYAACKNFWFRDRYMTYFYDLNCYSRSYDFKGEISESQRAVDRDYLEKEYVNWYKEIEGKESGNKLLNYVAAEAKHQIHLIEKYCKAAFLGRFREEYLIKSTVLHSKYIYLTVKEYFQELGADVLTVDLFGYEILIDSFSFQHIGILSLEFHVDKLSRPLL